MINNSNPPILKEDTNTGFSTKVQTRNQRSIRSDGSFNIENRGLKGLQPGDIYLHLITMSWSRFSLIVLTTYLLVNTVFAIIYFAIGTEYLTNIDSSTNWRRFLDTFFFSAQSLTTVGYGRVAPVGIPQSLVAAIESMVGLLGFALATGLLYGRFSKATAKIIHSKNILISPYQNGTGLMFRIANIRETQLVEVEVQVTISKIMIENEKEIRRFYPIELERSKISMFPLSWVIVHPINESSLLYGKSQEDLEREDMEVLVYFKAYDETFSQNVHYRISYRAEDLIWGAKFRINFQSQSDGPTLHFLDRIGEYEMVQLPVSKDVEIPEAESVVP
jgi:inward rectifier potassium channel